MFVVEIVVVDGAWPRPRPRPQTMLRVVAIVVDGAWPWPQTMFVVVVVVVVGAWPWPQTMLVVVGVVDDVVDICVVVLVVVGVAAVVVVVVVFVCLPSRCLVEGFGVSVVVSCRQFGQLCPTTTTHWMLHQHGMRVHVTAAVLTAGLIGWRNCQTMILPMVFATTCRAWQRNCRTKATASCAMQQNCRTTSTANWAML